jgi:hypothetical protein
MADEGKISMSKFLIRFCVLTSVFCSIAHASPQTIYTFSVDLHNACGYPVQVSATHYFDRISLADSKMNQRLEPDATTWVLSIGSTNDDVQRSIPENYKLEMRVNNKTISLDKTQFLIVLKKAKYQPFDYAMFHWIISDPSLCP